MGCSQCGCGNIRVPNGRKGDPGASAYQIWLALGNTGTEADFIASLQGGGGSAGADGSQILSGSGAPPSGLGSAGDWYFDNGTPGDITVYQNQGGTWVQVNQITSGEDGANGTNGLSLVVTQGVGDPASNPGQQPTLYFNTANGALWNWNVALQQWDIVIGTVIGTGAPGDPGDPGYSPEILFGSGTPSAGTGNDTDVYVDVQNAPTTLAWYVKASGSWSLQASINAAQTLYGSGVPSSGLGNVGDTYVNFADTAAPIWYKKTNSTTWTQQFQLTGAGTTGYLFRASVGSNQNLPLSTGVQKINFGDDATAPNFDEGGTWVGYRWLANDDYAAMQFVLQDLTISRDTTSDAVTYTVRIIQRASGGSTTTLASGSIIFSAAEASDKLANLSTGDVAITTGDEIYVEVEANVVPVTQFYVNDGYFFNQV